MTTVCQDDILNHFNLLMRKIRVENCNIDINLKQINVKQYLLFGDALAQKFVLYNK